MSINHTETTQWLVNLVRHAGDTALSLYHPLGTEHTYKEGAAEQAFSIADTTANEILTSGVIDTFPDHGIVSEELPDTINPDSPYRWIFDPIDGSRNFVNGIPFWGVFGCLTHHGEPISAAVYCPPIGLLYHAEKGRGAYVNGVRITCNATATLKGSLGTVVVAGHGVFVEEFRSAVHQVMTETSWLQNYGSLASIGYIASGGMDFFFANCCSDHDYAAPTLIARESGAIVSDKAGNPWTLGRKDIVIAPPQLHPHIINLLNGGC